MAKSNKKASIKSMNGPTSALYGMGFVGALIYNVQAADGIVALASGLLKALVWPAFIVYKLLEGFYGLA